MTRSISITAETFPLRRKFAIARGSKVRAEPVSVEIIENGVRGHGARGAAQGRDVVDDDVERARDLLGRRVARVVHDEPRRVGRRELDARLRRGGDGRGRVVERDGREERGHERGEEQ